ncbi:MAG: transcriptional repressor [Lachnospiraceae bacterium]|jgi:Fe2+/Zn2+ uptake regulation proteins|nr:transcriptional repressor [Lachnospiraceae bacterium]
MKKQRNSRQRKLILDIVASRHDHPTADQIYLDVRTQDSQISRGTVYRNLGILSENGEIANVKVPAADRYDSRLDRHYHMFCTGCKRVFDVPLEYQEQYDEQVEKETGFKISRHRLFFEGLCQECSLKQNN